MQLFHPENALWQGINKVLLMLYAGMLWFLCSIPIITMGAASSALMEVMMKLAKDQEGYIASSFFRAFRHNLPKGILTWLPFLISQLLFSVNALYYYLAGPAFRLQAALFIILLLFSLGTAAWSFAVTARFEMTAKETLRMALLLAVRNPGWTVFIILLQAAALFVCWFFVYLPLLFGAGLPVYVQAVVFNHVLDLHLERGTSTVQEAEEKTEA